MGTTSSAKEKLGKKLKKYLMYGGLERDQFAAIAPDLREYNRQLLTILTTALLLFVMGQLLATFFSTMLQYKRLLYVLALAILSIFNLISTTKVMDSQLGVKVYMYGIIVATYAYAIVLSMLPNTVKDGAGGHLCVRAGSYAGACLLMRRGAWGW